MNGFIETYIGVMTKRARTMLLHGMHKWPSVVTAEFWSFAYQQAVLIHNIMPDSDQPNQCPYTAFTDESPPTRLEHLRVPFCPAYVLDKRIQDGSRPPKWNSRCWQGVYCGQSPFHSGSVALIYNPKTQLVSPQFHVVFDQDFSSVTDDAPIVPHAVHQATVDRLFAKHAFWNYADEYEDGLEFPMPEEPSVPIHPTKRSGKRRSAHSSVPEGDTSVSEGGMSSHEGAMHRQKAASKSRSHNGTFRGNNDPVCPPAADRARQTAAPVCPPATDGVRQTAAQDIDPTQRDASDLHHVAQEKPTETPTSSIETRSSKRRRTEKGIAHIAYTTDPIRDEYLALHLAFLTSIPQISPLSDSLPMDTRLMILKDLVEVRDLVFDGSDPDGIYNMPENPISFAAAKKTSADDLTQSQMLKAPDRAEFLTGQTKEITGLINAKVFTFLPKESKPAAHNLLNAIWSYRRKRRPDGSLEKHKARICADGSRMQYGVDYWDIYSPVIQWSTLRLVMIISTLTNLKSRQVDFVQAFTQADIDQDVYMRVPQGWYYDIASKDLLQHADPQYQDPVSIIQLAKNLYGTRSASRSWWLHLKQGLISRNFKQAPNDPCLFVRDDCMIAVYTDDCCLFAETDLILDELIADMKKDFILEDQGQIENFLGINVQRKRTAEGLTINMTQTGLITSILQDVNLDSDLSKPENKVQLKNVPASGPLRPAPIGEPSHSESYDWNYRSVIGKLQFLAQNTRPDLTFAIHQTARYSNNPRKSHGEAVKHICRYLLKTRDKGIILKPDGTLELNAYVDADFAGTFNASNSHLRDSALSRSGFIIQFSGCPIVWASKMQTEIALSTTESEYQSLSLMCRTLLPMRVLLTWLVRTYNFKSNLSMGNSTVHHSTMSSSKNGKLKCSKIYEDNLGCIEVANKPDTYRPRTKHIGIRWHHFRDQITNGSLKIVPISTTEQLADAMTKALAAPLFERLRKGYMGW